MTQDTERNGDEGGAPIRVLVVDDDAEVADLVRLFLERADDGLSVTVATSAAAGLEEVREREFDAVVSDYHMPDMDGLAFLDRVADVAPATPGIVFSSDGAPRIAETVEEAGVPFLRKRMRPECFERLASAVRTAVRDRRE